jgi:adenylate kinase
VDKSQQSTSDSARTAINLVVLGAPGAGKGTQAVAFAQRHGIPKISTGDILRDAVRSGTGLGQRAKATLDAGGLVDDQLMIAIVRERLERPDAANGFVLDGFPRTVAQATALDEIMTDQGPLTVIDIAVPNDVLVERLARRRVCGECGLAMSVASDADEAGVAMLRCETCGGEFVLRSDDTESVVRERLRVYAEATRPLVDYYSNRTTFRTVDGNQGLADVAAALATAVDSVGAGVSAGSPVSEGAA